MTTKPWTRKNPKQGGKSTRLTRQEKARAKGRARKAGRPYPNLVDNMNEARRHKGRDR